MGRSIMVISSIFEHFSDLEFDLLDFIQSNVRNEFLDVVVPWITRLGDSGMIWILIAAVLFLLSKHRKVGLKLAIGLMLHLIVCNLVLKNVIGRLRPFYQNELVELLISAPDEFSFPSGHAMSSFVAATILYGYRKSWGVAAYLLAILISLSRIYLYVHFSTDILFGALFGILLGVFVHRSTVIDGLADKLLKREKTRI